MGIISYSRVSYGQQKLSPQYSLSVALSSSFCSLGVLQIHFYSSQVHYYISQDLLQLRYHVTELWAMDCVGRRNVNDFQDYSYKTIPRDPYFSFPVCQLDANDSAETFRSPRRWQVQRCKEPKTLNDCVKQSLSLPPCGISSPRGLDISGRSDFLSVAAGFLKSPCSKRLRRKLVARLLLT